MVLQKLNSPQFCLGFYDFSFIDNSNITKNYLHHDEIHLNKVGSFFLGKAKWLVVACYHPLSQNGDYYFCSFNEALDSLNSNYEKFLLIGDF